VENLQSMLSELKEEKQSTKERLKELEAMSGGKKTEDITKEQALDSAINRLISEFTKALDGKQGKNTLQNNAMKN